MRAARGGGGDRLPLRDPLGTLGHALPRRAGAPQARPLLRDASARRRVQRRQGGGRDSLGITERSARRPLVSPRDISSGVVRLRRPRASAAHPARERGRAEALAGGRTAAAAPRARPAPSGAAGWGGSGPPEGGE